MECPFETRFFNRHGRPEKEYINSINSLKIAKPILTKIDFSNVADSQKEDSDDSDESKTPQKTQ